MKLLNECESCKHYDLSLVDACKVNEVELTAWDFYDDTCPLFERELNQNKLTARLVAKML